MLRNLSIGLLTAVCLGALSSLAPAQKNAAEEKREADKIKNAEQALAKARNEFSSAEKKFNAAVKEWKNAEARVSKDKLGIDRARVAAEDKLEDSTGLPKAIRAYEAAKSDFAKISASLRVTIQQSSAYLAAKAKADEALEAKENLRNQVELQGGELTQRIGELNKLVRAPEELEQGEVLKDRSAKQAYDEMLKNQKEAAAIREKIKDRLDNELGVKKAVAELQNAIKDEQAAERAAGAARSTAQREQQQVAQAQKHLNDAKEADRKDDAEDKKSMNTKNNNNKKK